MTSPPASSNAAAEPLTSVARFVWLRHIRDFSDDSLGAVYEGLRVAFFEEDIIAVVEHTTNTLRSTK
jgi:hypothetical protein